MPEGGAICVLYRSVFFMVYLLSAGSIGIIGSADGPTAVFVTYPDDWWKYALGAAVVLTAAIAFILCGKRGK